MLQPIQFMSKFTATNEDISIWFSFLEILSGHYEL